jgi:hypothetical protein
MTKLVVAYRNFANTPKTVSPKMEFAKNGNLSNLDTSNRKQIGNRGFTNIN